MEFCNGTAWGNMAGTAFTAVTQISPASNTWYGNNTGGPLYLASLCPDTVGANGYTEAVSFYTSSPTGGTTEVSYGKVAEGGTDAHFQAAPFASAIVPAGYAWLVNISGNISSCNITATASAPYTSLSAPTTGCAVGSSLYGSGATWSGQTGTGTTTSAITCWDNSAGLENYSYPIYTNYLCTGSSVSATSTSNGTVTDTGTNNCPAQPSNNGGGGGGEGGGGP